MKNKAVILGFLLCASLVQAVTVTDARGTAVSVPDKPQRVVILNSSLLDLWYECGGSAVGRVDAHSGQMPAQAKPLPSVGGLTTPSAERVLALRPDLVLLHHRMDSHDRLIPLLNASGIATLSLQNETIDDYRNLSQLFYQLNGKDTADPRANWKITLDSVQKIMQRERPQKSPKVLILFGSARDVTVRTADSHVGAMVKDLGGRNIAEALPLKGDGAAVFSLERIVEMDPDMILLQCMGDEKAIAKRIDKQFASSPAWKNLRAVRNGKYHILPKELFLYKPNARWPEAYEQLARLMYDN